MVTLSAFAQLSGDGYYRVHNYVTGRYVYVTDDKGKLDYATTSADMYAIQLWKGFEKASSDPATVCYIKAVDGKYDILAQGTGIYEIISSYVSLRKNGDGTYYAYGSKEGITKYLGDGEKGDVDEGVMSDATSGNYRKWYITPINTADGSYLGVKGAVRAGGKYYTPYYASFPFSFASSGMKAYYVSKIGYGMAVMKEVTGTVPAEMPVFIMQSSQAASSNRLNVGGTATAPAGNMLKGVYFNNDMPSHYNRVAYNSSTMRMLGVTSTGAIGFVTAKINFIPANYSYLSVPAGTPAELKLVTEAEYEAFLKEQLAQSITLDRTSVSVEEGSQFKLTATVKPDKAASQTLTWTSSNKAVATVDATGLVKVLAQGTATITVATTDGSNLKATCTVTGTKILAKTITLDRTTASVDEGTQFKLTATVTPASVASQTLTWTSSNTAVATVDATGVVKALTPGTATITVATTDGSNLKATCAVTVNKILASSITLDRTTASVDEGTQFKLTATVTPASVASQTLTWTSSNTAVATVDATGVVKALTPGTATITVATTDGSNLKATCAVTVNKILAQSITLNVTTISLEVGAESRLVATVTPDKAASQTLTWTSSNQSIATVDATGLVKVLAAGSATITVATTDGSNLKATCVVTGLSGVDAVFAGIEGTTVDVYTIGGVLVRKNATIDDVKSLDAGFYLIGNKKVAIAK